MKRKIQSNVVFPALTAPSFGHIIHTEIAELALLLSSAVCCDSAGPAQCERTDIDHVVKHSVGQTAAAHGILIA